MPRIFLTFDGDMEGEPIINLGAGVGPTDAVNKSQLDAKLNAAEKGQANGVATLDAAGTVPTGQIPPLPYVPTSQKGQANGVATLDAAGKVPASQLDVGPTFDGDMQGTSLINLGAGTAATDAVNKGQMDAQLTAKLNAAEKARPMALRRWMRAARYRRRSFRRSRAQSALPVASARRAASISTAQPSRWSISPMAARRSRRSPRWLSST